MSDELKPYFRVSYRMSGDVEVEISQGPDARLPMSNPYSFVPWVLDAEILPPCEGWEWLVAKGCPKSIAFQLVADVIARKCWGFPRCYMGPWTTGDTLSPYVERGG